MLTEAGTAACCLSAEASWRRSFCPTWTACFLAVALEAASSLRSISFLLAGESGPLVAGIIDLFPSMAAGAAHSRTVGTRLSYTDLVIDGAETNQR